MAETLAKNSSSNGWVVQKFGGTSVGKFPDKIAEDIIRYESSSCELLSLFVNEKRHSVSPC